MVGVSEVMNKISKQIINCFKRGNKVLICGCGGSATMSHHFAGELVGRFLHKRKALPAIALLDIAVVTAIANDYGFNYVFSRQIEALGKKGDILITLSTSGESTSVIYAIWEAEERGLEVIDFPREGDNTPEIQEYQFELMHQVCKEVEEAFI